MVSPKQHWHDNMSGTNLESTPKYEELEERIDELQTILDEIENSISEAENIEFPRAF